MQRILNALVFEEDGWHIAQCVELDLASQGNTLDEAFRNLQEAMTLHLQAPSSTELGAFANSLEEARLICTNSTLFTWEVQ